MSVWYAAESWPEHSDDLKTIIVGQCAIQLHGSVLKFSASSADIAKINKLVETHPLNETQEQFGVDTCAKILRSLAQENSESQNMVSLKVQLLRKVQLYIERGLSVLRNEPIIETLTPAQKSRKRTRSQSEVEKPTRKQKLGPDVASDPMGSSVKPDSESSPLQAEPVATEQDIQQQQQPMRQHSLIGKSNNEESNLEDSKSEDSNMEQQRTEPPDTEPPDTEPPDAEQSNPEQSDAEQSNPEQSNPEQSNPEQSNPEQSNPEQSNPEQPALETFEAGEVSGDSNEPSSRPEETNLPEEDPPAAKHHSELEAEQAELQRQREDQRAQEQQERISRRRSRTRRSARNTPEPEAQPEVRLASETKAEPKNSIKGTSKPGLQNNSTEPLPENKELGDEKAQTGQSPVSDKEEKEDSEKMVKGEKDEPLAKRKRSVTFDDGGLSPLAELLSNIMSHKAMAPFKDTDFNNSPIVLSPISLETVLENVQNNTLDTVDDVQVELLKLVANGVMAAEIDRKQSKNAIAIIDSAISQFREDTMGNISNSKRRRR